MTLSENTMQTIDERFRLIFHVGAGKTGTSAIQDSLLRAKPSLNQQGFDYWGLMLELAPIKRYQWQRPSVKSGFLDLPKESAKHQLLDILSTSIQNAIQKGIHTAIWSHELFFSHTENVIPALQSLRDKGVDIDIFAYVRRHDAWARSSYFQWSIKHKTYEGPLIPFREFVNNRPIRFAPALNRWSEAFPDHFTIRNYDKAKDVVSDFTSAIQAPLKIPSARSNNPMSNEEVLLRAIFNDKIENEALPNAFSKIFNIDALNFDLSPDAWLGELLPSSEDLRHVVNSCRDDYDEVNSMLAKQGQEPLNTEDGDVSEVFSIDQGKVEFILIQMLLQQGRKLQRLQRKYRDLEQKVDTLLGQA